MSHWRVHPVAAPGPYIGLTVDSLGNRWLSSAAVRGLIRLDSGGGTTIFRTGDFEPAYLTLGQDGRIWTTLRNHGDQIGAMTEGGQFTTYFQPRGVGEIPASQMTSLENFGLMYVGARTGLIKIFGGEGGEQPYLSGLKWNEDVAMALAPGFVPWFTECCLPFGGAVGVATESGLIEYPLPYPECTHPAGIAIQTALSQAFVPCEGSERTILVSIDESTGYTQSVPFPGRYPARIDTVAAGFLKSELFFSTGATRGLIKYDAPAQKFTTIPAPDAIVPTAVFQEAAAYGVFYVFAGERHTLYEYDP